MKIALDESIDLDFNQWNLDQAGKHIESIRSKSGNKADDVLRAVLTLLLFGQIEQQNPGTIGRLSSSAEDIAKALAGPKVDESA